MKTIRQIALTPYYPYGKNKEKIMAERTERVDKAISEHDAEIRADEREKIKKIAEKHIKEHYFPHSRTIEIVKYFVEGVVEEYGKEQK